MKYRTFLDEVRKLEFVHDDRLADAEVKAVLGILASRLDPAHARILTGNLPRPLTYHRLRTEQSCPTEISVRQYISCIARQFSLEHEQAQRLVMTVLHIAKKCVEENALEEIEEGLPEEWIETLDRA